MSAHEFTIPVSDLDAGGKEFKFTVRPAWLRGAFEDHEATAAEIPGTLAVRASKSGSDVVVHGTLDATLRVPCARCLEPFDLPLHSDLTVIYVPAARIKGPAPSKAAAESKDETATSEKSTGKSASKKKAEEVEEEYEFTSEEADTLGYDGETVVLDDLVRDELILEIPMIPLCSDACPGMSPAPGEPQAPSEEKGIDPRLAPLLRFRAKETKS